MSWWDFVLGRPTTLEAAVPAETFAVDETSVPYELFGIQQASDPTSPVTKISRKSARQVPAVKRARDLIAGTLGTVPLELIDADNQVQPSSLLEQPEENFPRSITFARLFEDLLYEGIAYWRVKATDYRGFPTSVERIEPDRVRVDKGLVWLDGHQVRNDKLIRFDSPNGALLQDGARAIKTLLRLEAAAANQAEDPMPQGYFRPTEDAEPLTDSEIPTFLGDWKRARQTGSTGYVPRSVEYLNLAFSPEQLQMADARQHAVLEIARLTSIDAEDLSVSTTTRTYQNAQQRRIERINDTLGPYSVAVTDRLSMRDITPRGYKVRADFTQFLRADDATRLANYAAARALGLLDLEQIATREGLPTPEESDRPQAVANVVREAEGITQGGIAS